MLDNIAISPSVTIVCNLLTAMLLAIICLEKKKYDLSFLTEQNILFVFLVVEMTKTDIVYH